jgi:hypothetical protein
MTTKEIVYTVVFLLVCALFAAMVLRQLKKGNPLRQFRVMDQELKGLSFTSLGNCQIKSQNSSYSWDGCLAYALTPGYLIIREKPLLFEGKSYHRIPLDCLDIDVDPEPGCMSQHTEMGVLKWNTDTDLVSEIRTYTGR